MPQTLEELTRKIDSLPTLPEIYQTVSGMLENPKVNASAVADVISRDPALTAKLLKMVNSTFYGLPQNVSTLTHALVLLGFSTVKNLILTMGLADIFSKNRNEDFPRSAFWAHCFGTGLISKSIAVRIGYGKVEEIFIQGLLHDIGKIILDRYAPEAFAGILQHVREENILIVESEARVLGYTHAEVGALVARKWNLPENICRAIAYHHAPQQSGDSYTETETAMIHLADILCRAKQIGSGGDRKIPRLDENAWQALGLQWEALAGIMREAESFEDCVSFFGGNAK